MAPCVLFVDEVERLCRVLPLAAAATVVSVQDCSGPYLLGLMITQAMVYVAMTCNNIKQLPPEFSRAETIRCDHVSRSSSAKERESIWATAEPSMRSTTAIQHRPMKVDAAPRSKHAADSVCCLVVSLREAARYVVPLSATAAEGIAELRSGPLDAAWMQADPVSRVVSGGKEATATPARRVRVYRPSDN